MKANRILVLSCTLMLPAGAAIAQQQATLERSGHLQCGLAQLNAETRYLDLPDQTRQVLAQSLSLTNTAMGSTRQLKHDARPLRQPFLKHTPVLDAAVTGWACLENSAGKPYIYLSYTCIESPSRPACVGNLREWARLFDTAGKPLNAHAPRSGQRTAALLKKLGLGHHLSAGVSLQDIDK